MAYSSNQKQQGVDLLTLFKKGRITEAQLQRGLQGVYSQGPTKKTASDSFVTRATQPTYNKLNSNPVARPVNRGLEAAVMGVNRSGLGTAQGLSGLYDLISPGQGTNRFTKAAQNQAARTDNYVADRNLSRPVYQGAQFGTDVATFVAGGAPLEKGVGAVTNTLGKLPGGAARTSAAVRMATSGPVGSEAIRAGKYLTNPSTIASIVSDVALSSGQRSAQGQAVTGRTVGMDALASAIPATAAGATGRAVNKVAPGIADATRTVSRNTYDPGTAASAKRLAAVMRGERVAKRDAQYLAGDLANVQRAAKELGLSDKDMRNLTKRILKIQQQSKLFSR